MVLNKAQATAELETWFSKKKIKETQKATQVDAVNILIEALQDGDLVLDQTTNEFTQKLMFPVGKDEAVKTLKYKPRLNDAQLRPFKEGDKPGSGADLILSTLAALTDVGKTILSTVDTQDKRVCNSIVVFFL